MTRSCSTQHFRKQNICDRLDVTDPQRHTLLLEEPPQAEEQSGWYSSCEPNPFGLLHFWWWCDSHVSRSSSLITQSNRHFWDPCSTRCTAQSIECALRWWHSGNGILLSSHERWDSPQQSPKGQFFWEEPRFFSQRGCKARLNINARLSTVSQQRCPNNIHMSTG